VTSRQPGGIPSGGQFAANRRGRAVIELSEDSEVIELLDADPDQARIARGEAAHMPYETGRRYVAARLLELRAAATAKAIWKEAEGAYQADQKSFFDDGATPDQVEIDGTVFYQAKPGRTFREPYSMVLVADRPISDDEMQHLAQLAGYAYSSTVHGEPLGEPNRLSDYAFMLEADTTKGSPGGVGDFIEQYPTMVGDGSPVRKTDRAGAGTQGTRLVEGMGPDAPQIVMYFDDAQEDAGSASSSPG
jgi:hypothetical protein